MPEVVGDIRGQDDVLHLVQGGLVVGRTEVLKHIAALSVEDAQSLSEMVPLHSVRGRGWVGKGGCVRVCIPISTIPRESDYKSLIYLHDRSL